MMTIANMSKNENPIINDKCYECKFCRYSDRLRDFKCMIKGCYENSKSVEFKLDEFIHSVR